MGHQLLLFVSLVVFLWMGTAAAVNSARGHEITWYRLLIPILAAVTFCWAKGWLS